MPDRVASHAQAQSMCAPLGEEFDQINLLRLQASEARQRAYEIVDEACGDGFWSLSTLGDVVGLSATVGACFATPFGWVVCGAGVVGGAGTIIISEASRDPQAGPLCDEAMDLAAQSAMTLDLVDEAWLDRLTLENDCIRHHWKWWGPQV